ncbi:MAG: DUF1829 domain-containing protein [Chloroflexi bacterium]|nr:DUF1829 domain-containing protein [Chloroflexota bacterium]
MTNDVDDIQELLDDYLGWLRDNTVLRQMEDWVEITTPYLDRHNDRLQIYAKRQPEGYVLTDDGYILDDLQQSGFKLEGDHRHNLLRVTLNGFGIHRAGNTLQVQVSKENFARRKHNLLQAMLSVNDLFAVAQPSVERLFQDDVVNWLDTSDIRYLSDAKFTGVSGFEHLFHFSIPKSQSHPERFVRTINRPSNDQAKVTAFAWIDIKDARPEGAKAYAILNDSERRVSGNVIEAMEAYGVVPIKWSEREQAREELAA